MALTLSVGFVVDDAIVMLENIVRHMELGMPRMEAALEGSREIAFTILSMTLSLTAVFIPVLFMGGVVGRLMHEFAVTIAAAILVSGVVSLTLTPMLCSRFLKPPQSERHGRLYNFVEAGFNALLRGYAWTLDQSIRFKATTMTIGGVLLVATAYLFTVVSTGFIPSVDIGQLNGQIEAAEGVGYEALVASTQQVMKVFAEDPKYRELHGQRRRRQRPDQPDLAAERSNALGRPGDPGTATEVREDSGSPRLHHQSAGHPYRRPLVAKRIPVHPAGNRHPGALSSGARLSGESCPAARFAGCDVRSADHHARARRRSRSRADRRPGSDG
jgi:hypothetical protein